MLTALAEKIIAISPPRYQKTVKQFVKFAIAGTIGAILDYSSYILLTRFFDFNPIWPIFGYSFLGANIISVLFALSIMFSVNKYWTFRNTERNVVRQGVGYFALNGTTFVLNQILTSFFVFYVPLIGQVFGSSKDLVAKALAIGLILFLNFFGSKFLVFSQKDGHVVPTVSS